MLTLRELLIPFLITLIIACYKPLQFKVDIGEET